MNRGVGRRQVLAGAVGLVAAATLAACRNDDEPDPGPTATYTLPSLAYFYRPPADGQLAPVAENFDHVILTQLDEPARDELTSLGLDVPILQYLRFEAIMDDGLDHTWHNQVAYESGDWEWISNDHPDWFLLDQDGERVRAGWGDPSEEHFFLMDPASPGWRDFFIERARQMRAQAGWDGLFLDNVEVSLAKRERAGQIPAAYPDDATYRAAVLDFLAHVRAEVEGPVEANVIEQRSVRDGTWLAAAEHLDSAFWEGWGIGWPGIGLPSRRQWENELTLAEQTQAEGVGITLVALGDQDDEERQQIAYASYLLVAGPDAHFRYTHTSRYDEVWLYPNYQVDLGPPTGPRVQDGDRWVRGFVNGEVSVNPTTWDFRIG